MLIPVTDAPSLEGKRVLIRTSLNVPLKDGKVIDPTRILEALPTILYVQKCGGKAILISHHSGGSDTSLLPIYETFSELVPASFVHDIFSPEVAEILQEMEDGAIVMVENIRQYAGEEGASADFAKKLSALADFYVNDDFTSAHREHASVVLVPKLLPSFMGLQFEKEYTQLSKAFNPNHPAVLILGGAKPETKLPIAEALLSKMDTVFLGGVGANMAFQTEGYEIGQSIVGDTPVPSLKNMLLVSNIVLPKDVRVKKSRTKAKVKEPQDVAVDEMIVDAGPETLEQLIHLIQDAKFVLWNGPLGHYELGYTESTHALAEALALSHAMTIIGGGDTVAAIGHLGLNDKFTFVSTAGGAMLDFLAQGTLPGIEALK